jgi:hypothetical protein
MKIISHNDACATFSARALRNRFGVSIETARNLKLGKAVEITAEQKKGLLGAGVCKELTESKTAADKTKGGDK